MRKKTDTSLLNVTPYYHIKVGSRALIHGCVNPIPVGHDPIKSGFSLSHVIHGLLRY